MPRLRRADCSDPGISRRRRGRGFEYVRVDGTRVRDRRVLKRIEELAIPPAWEDVWVCEDQLGHIQATGTDARGRKQYRYHDRWRERRDREKYESMLEFGRALPKLRKRVDEDLGRRGYVRDRILACAVRLLDRGFFRIGSEGYADENQTYGVATIRRRHVRVRADTVTFDYEAKGGARRVQAIMDEDLAKLIRALMARKGGGHELLAYKAKGEWRDVRSDDINEYVKGASGGEFSAKDFRTWNGTVLAAVALAAYASERETDTKAKRERAKRLAVEQVARFLGNTPAVCRALLHRPARARPLRRRAHDRRRLERLPDDPSEWPEVQGPIEKGVLDLLEKRESSAALERI